MTSYVVKIINSFRRSSKRLTPASTVLWECSSVQSTPKSKIQPTSTIKLELWNALFGEKLDDFAGNIPYAVIRLTSLPIKAFDLTPKNEFDGFETIITPLDIFIETKKKGNEYNKIVPKCNPDCNPPPACPPCPPCSPRTGSPKAPKNKPSGAPKDFPYPCPGKKTITYKEYPGCTPKKQIYALKRDLSTFNRDFSTAKDDIRHRKKDPADPSADPAMPHDKPQQPEENPSNPQRNPSNDPHKPDKSVPNRQDN